MREFDDWLILGTIALLALSGLLHAQVARVQAEEIIELRHDVEFLRSVAVARETEDA